MHLATRQPVRCTLCTLCATRWGTLRVVGKERKGSIRKRTRSTQSQSSASRTESRHTPSNFKSLSDRSVKSFARSQNPFHNSGSSFARENITNSTLANLIQAQWSKIGRKISNMHSLAELQELGIESKQELTEWTDKFEKELKRSCAEVASTNATTDGPNAMITRLRKFYIAEDVKGLQGALKYSLMSFVFDGKFSQENLKNQQRVTDLRYPLEWYPQTRAMQRKVHLHVGPTNSGKTYQALKRLEAAESGIYAGPLRLLAHEVYTRLNANGRLCSLVTGEERRIPEGQDTFLSSCTVEMLPIGAEVDVAVIDEIQMISDNDRGWAWTRAFLGTRAKEIHLCGELRTVPLIRDLCAAMGDSLEIHKYERLSPLKPMKGSLKGDLRNLQKGDAIILFSRLAIHAMKKEIELATKKRCAVVYGSLPPETRAQQANLFNDPNNDYDYLVASDAVGMGLNLAIKRVVFETTVKWNGMQHCTLNNSDIKQIAGRAGRYRTAIEAIQNNPLSNPNGGASGNKSLGSIEKGQDTVGLVTTLEDIDMPIIQRAMATEVTPLASASIRPPSDVIMRFAAYFPPGTKFSYILTRLYDICTVLPQFQICRFKEHLAIADCIQHLDLTIQDRITLIVAPANFKIEGMESVTRALATCIASQSSGHILDIKEIDLELLDKPPQFGVNDYLRRMEAMHQAVTLYLWLSYRFAGVFKSQGLAFHIRSLVEEKIDQCLANVKVRPARRQKLKFLRGRQVALHIEAGAPKSDKTKILLPSEWQGNLQPEISPELASEKEVGDIATAA